MGLITGAERKIPALASLAKERQAPIAARHPIKNVRDDSMQTLEPFDIRVPKKQAKRQENFCLMW